MTALSDAELRRGRWRRALHLHGLDTIDRDDFALGGLAARLPDVTVQLLMLPADPEVSILDFDSAFWAWLDAQQDVVIEGRALRFGDQKCPTAHAAAMVGGYRSRESWNSYLAVHRSGAIEFGLGDRGGWERENREGERVRVFNLVSTVAYTWALLRFCAVLNERTPRPGPRLLTIGVRGTKGALLGNVGTGWAELGSFENRVGTCVDTSLLWHLELDKVLDEDGERRVAFTVGDRLEDAWGVVQRRYLARTGDRNGRLDVRHVAQ